MTQFLLLGLIPKETAPLHCEVEHMCLQTKQWTALVLPLDGSADPDDPEENAERMMHWAAQKNIVLATYVTKTDVLPVPLGAVFSGQTALENYLAQCADTLATSHDTVAGHCEYILQITPKDPAPAPVAPSSNGGGFLQARKAVRDQRVHRTSARQKFVRTISQQLETLTTQSLSRDTAGKPILADLSLLIERPKTADLLAALQQRADDSSALGLAMRLIGPNPAYSFVQGGQTNG